MPLCSVDMSFSLHAVALGIIALNAVVLCCWRIPLMQRSMIKYFTSNPASSEFTLCLSCKMNANTHLGLIGWEVSYLIACLVWTPEWIYLLWKISNKSLSTRNAVPSHDPLLLQPLLHHPYGGKHVCPVDIFFRNRLSLRERAVSCCLHVCRWVQ